MARSSKQKSKRGSTGVGRIASGNGSRRGTEGYTTRTMPAFNVEGSITQNAPLPILGKKRKSSFVRDIVFNEQAG